MTATATDNHYMNPDIAIILDLDDEEVRLKRIEARGELENPDTFESKGGDFQQRVKDAYINIASTYKIPIVSASGSITEVTDEIWSIVEPRI